MTRSLLLSALCLLAACGSGPAGDPRAEIEAAIDAHLAKRTDLDLGAMEVAVDSVDVQGDSAEAVVSFRGQGAAEAAMTMTYQLTRGEGGWAVQPKSGMGHGGVTPPPRADDDQGLPPGHPPTAGEAPAQELPPGHPPVSQ